MDCHETTPSHSMPTRVPARRARRRANIPGEPPRARAPRPHQLFPPLGSEPAARDIQSIGIRRKRADGVIEYCPRDVPADELPDWLAVLRRFGGGAYRVSAKDSTGRIVAWAPNDDFYGRWFCMTGRPKPLREDEEEEAPAPSPAPAAPTRATLPAAPTRALPAAPAPVALPAAPAPVALPAPPAPAAPPAIDVGALMLVVQKFQNDAADRLMQMQNDAADRLMRMQNDAADRLVQTLTRENELLTRIIVTLLTQREAPPATAPQPDLLAAVMLGVEIGKGQAAAPPAPPTVDPYAQARSVIALVRDIRTLVPAHAANGASDVAQVKTMFADLVTRLKAGPATTEEAAHGEAPQGPTTVLYDGRYLTANAAAEEYARAGAGQPPLASATSDPAALLAPPTEAPAPVASSPNAPPPAAATAASTKGDWPSLPVVPTAAAPPPPGASPSEQGPKKFLYFGHYLTVKEVVAECFRRMAGQPPLEPATAAPAASSAPAAAAPAPVAQPPVAVAAPQLLLTVVGRAPLGVQPSLLVIPAALDAGVAANVSGRTASASPPAAAEEPAAAPEAPSCGGAPSTSAPSCHEAPSTSGPSCGGAPSTSAPSCGGAPSTVAPSSEGAASSSSSAASPSGAPPSSGSSVAPAVAATLAAIPRELIGHVAGLDPGQLRALTRMPPQMIAQSVRGLAGMDEVKAAAFANSIGNLQPSAVPGLALALLTEAKASDVGADRARG
jgi:hypothetical protein